MMSALMMMTFDEAIIMMAFVYATIVTMVFVHGFNNKDEEES